MGCTVSVASKKVDAEKVFFPLSMYQSSLLQQTWLIVEENLIEFGNGLFYKLFKSKPELKNLFPEFSVHASLEDIRSATTLTGHPYKITMALKEAIISLNDADNFISKMVSLGEQHVQNNLKPEYLAALGNAFNDQIKETLHGQEPDVFRAWNDFYIFICKLMKQGLARRLQREKNAKAP